MFMAQRSVKVFLSTGLCAFVLASVVGAQSPDDLRDLVQMPVAVNKAADAGIPRGDVENISRSLREGRVSPREFNQTLRDVSTVAAEKGPDGVKDIGNHVSAQVRQGVRGQDLANSIHGRLRTHGIPAGGNRGQGPPPIARDFIPEQAKERIRERAGPPGKAEQRGGAPERTREEKAPGQSPAAKSEEVERGQSPRGGSEQRERSAEGTRDRSEQRGDAPAKESRGDAPAEKTQPPAKRDDRGGGGSGGGSPRGGGGSGGGGGPAKGGR